MRLSLFRCLGQIFERAILTDAALRSQGFSMFFSRLGEPQRLQQSLRVRLAKADHLAVGAIEGEQPRFQSTDFQRLAITQACLGVGIELSAGQPFEQRPEWEQRWTTI